ncbi:MAG: class II aldolase/adducin family protein [Hydrogenophaga sp.]|uniref:class II aldolase/adducin family protein n=1 Tax=Hydrogenophaga sp. TaxID=1904254 RepID=UPI001D6E7CDA|nr:class II aldolase/adducin family protein [Hydrogenophaga sp.]MBX3609228.1 class II aldolase/adducin family protein [Hydrogenophaga sp.]
MSAEVMAAALTWTQEEARLREELAACYRLFDWLGWTELIFNHITLRLPQAADEAASYLINPFGLHYAEVTANNLVAIDLAGQRRDADAGDVNRAGFVIHSAIHAARPDAHCIMHVHTTAGCAVSCKEQGLRHDNFYSAMLVDDVGYHDYQGVTTRSEEQPHLVASLGQRNHLVLRHHGLLVVGPDLPTTFMRLWVMQRACEVQLAADAGAGPNREIPREVLQGVPASRVTTDASGARKVYEAMLRRAGLTTGPHPHTGLSTSSPPR